MVAGLVSFIVGNILYLNPWVSAIYAANPWVGASDMMQFGSLMNWLLVMGLGGIVATIFLAALYAYTEKGLPVKSVWQKGLCFGLLLWLVSTLPLAFNTWLLMTYPVILITIEVINGLIGGLVAGVTLAIVYNKFK